MEEKVSRIVLWAPPIIWAILIFFLSTLPAIDTTGEYLTDAIIKKTLHVIIYGVFYVLLFRAINFGRIKKTYVLPFILLFLYAISDEIHQTFVPGREGTVRDLFFDSAGALIALWLLKYSLPKAPGRLQVWVNGLQEE